MSKEPYIMSKEPYIMSKEPNTLPNYCVQSLDMAATHSLSVAATDSLYNCN